MYKTSIGALPDSCAAIDKGNKWPNLGGVGGWGLRLGPGLSEARTGPNFIRARLQQYLIFINQRKFWLTDE
jgi:hypothetical protein